MLFANPVPIKVVLILIQRYPLNFFPNICALSIFYALRFSIRVQLSFSTIATPS